MCAAPRSNLHEPPPGSVADVLPVPNARMLALAAQLTRSASLRAQINFYFSLN